MRQRQHSAWVAHRKSSALLRPLAGCSYTGTNRPDKRFRALVGTPPYERSRRACYKIEALFAELKQRMRLGRVRLRRLWNVAERFQLAATAQNIKRLVRFLAKRPQVPQLSTA
jgi:hypothetical protein